MTRTTTPVRSLAPSPSRITDFISLGVIARAFPLSRIQKVLAETHKSSVRQRQLPAHVVVYYVLALTLFFDASSKEVLRILLEGLKSLFPNQLIKATGKSGISQARTRLGSEPLKRLHEALVTPIATPHTRGAHFHHWNIVSIDGSSLSLEDTDENAAVFHRPAASRGESAFPKLRFVSLVENGTHVLFGTEFDSFSTSEQVLAERVFHHLRPGMFCLADRNFYGFKLWKLAANTQADPLWRVKKNLSLPVEAVLSDGSYLSTVYSNNSQRRKKKGGLVVRVIEYRLDGVPDAEPLYRLITTVLNPKLASAVELAALYHERWEIETVLDELKPHLKGAGILLRSKTPELVRQEFYALLMTHFAIRGLMHEAALKDDLDPDQLSYLHAIRVIRRTLPRFVATPPKA